MSLDFLSPNFCKEIKNVLSSFLDVNMRFINMCIVSFSRILEGIDQRDGLASEMNLQKGSILFSQQLEYLGVPFKCTRCYCYKHVTEDYEILFQNKVYICKDM